MATDTIPRTWDPKLLIITFGPIVMFGFAEGTFCTITRSGDLFTKQKGADGSIDRVNNNAYDYGIEVTLKQTSITNDLLSAVMIQDQLSNTGKYPFTIKDLNGNTTFFAPLAWIEKDPDPEFADGLSSRMWRFATGPAQMFIGGNIL